MIIIRKFKTLCKLSKSLFKDRLFTLTHPIKIYDTKATLEKIINERQSISRFGDGEFNLINGQDLKFQKYNKELALRLCDILKVNNKADNHLTAIPYVYYSLKGKNKNSKNFWRIYLIDNRKSIYSLLNKNYSYYDSQITRIYINRRNKNQSVEFLNYWKKIWSSKDILIVEGELSRFGVGNDLFDNVKIIKRILCPSVNAYDKYNEIVSNIKQNYNGQLVLVILGPTATVMAYDLARIGIWALDIGNLDMEYEWLMAKADTQQKIEGKYSIETEQGTTVENIKNEEYQRQIIAKIL